MQMPEIEAAGAFLILTLGQHTQIPEAFCPQGQTDNITLMDIIQVILSDFLQSYETNV